jgi:hypothetical protein
MFFTVCVSPCADQAYNQLWSVTSGDGIHWVYPQQIITGGNGPAEPSAIIDPQSNGTFWKVYYMNSGNDETNVWMAEIGGNRNFLGAQIVYTFPAGYSIANPEVRNINGIWRLFFNIYQSGPSGTEANIASSASGTNMQWPPSYSLLIGNGGPSICGTIAAGVYPLNGGQYQLYFGQTPRQSNGSCDISQQTTMQMWTWQQ